MSPRTLAILVVLGIAALAGGWYFGTATKPEQQVAVDAGRLMFPGLAPKLQNATKIEISNQDKTLVIERKNDRWGLASRGDYPVIDTKLRGMLTALTELRLVEPRTADPEQFARLGLQDPEAKDSKANLLRVLDAQGQPLVAVIVGHRRVRTQAKVAEQVYVRRPGENQTWLAEGSLQVDADPQLWLDRDIMNIPHTRIATVAVTHGESSLDFAAKDGKLVVMKPSEHPPLEEYRVEDVWRALETLTFQDVQTDAAPAGEAIGQSEFTTTDGLVITAKVLRGEKDSILARFAVAGADKVKEEAERLNARLAGWTYQLGSWKEKALVPVLDDLKKAEEKPAAGDAAVPPPPPVSATTQAPDAAPPAPATTDAPAPADTAAPAAAEPQGSEAAKP
ncbi:MAG: DUF4340 domain-containing protein [Acetobacteraceae bacterium]